MPPIRWTHLLLCALVTGLTWALLGAVIITFAGSGLQASIPGLRDAPGKALLFFSLIVNLATGVWAMWLYAIVRPRYSRWWKAALVAGFALWCINALAKANWAPYGLVQVRPMVLIVIATLPALLIATLLGARLYEQ